MDVAVEEPSIDLRGILEQAHNVFSIVGLIANTILFYLIIAKTDDKLKEYKKLLLQNCVIYTIYNFAQFITRMVRFGIHQPYSCQLHIFSKLNTKMEIFSS